MKYLGAILQSNPESDATAAIETTVSKGEMTFFNPQLFIELITNVLIVVIYILYLIVN